MKIGLAIDSSAQSGVAVNQVASRPWSPGTTVEVLSVVEPSNTMYSAQLVERATEQAEGLVQRGTELLRENQIQATPIVLSGDPKAVIVDHAAETNFVVALIAHQRVRESRVQQERLVTALADRKRLAYVRYRGGVDTLLNALDADRDLYQAQLTLSQIRLNEVLSVVQLYKALGGGWQ